MYLKKQTYIRVKLKGITLTLISQNWRIKVIPGKETQKVTLGSLLLWVPFLTYDDTH